ncbi:hypothetical protein [Comamonas koreensis]|uniref:hypothetical protein n=1 Tax=Comamonas koreensis TaxID=160825 RepID=UPI0015F7ED54|nr:hypothetical protein [Comamonas koreensis]
MTQPIPVHVGDQSFSSINQARLCFTGILHRYPVGATLIEEDRQHVLQLLSAQQAGYIAPIREVQVVRAQFGRSCFELSWSKNNRQKISIMKSIKQKVLEES